MMKFKESKLPSSAMLAIMSIVFSVIGVYFFQKYFIDLNGNGSKLVFIAYLSTYTAMWTLYFSSKNGPKIFQVPTLRRILLVESKSWTNIDSTDNDEIEEISMEKAKTSITSIAMLVGVSFLGLVQAKIGLSGLNSGEEEFLWKQFIFILLGFSSTIALVCFVISVDALDCMFNEFKNDQIDNKFRRYFYKSTIHPRYIGFVCLLTSVIFLNVSSSVLLGSLTIAVIISVGYRHWFPRSQLAEETWEERSGVPGFWARFIPLIAIPIAFQFLEF